MPPTRNAQQDESASAPSKRKPFVKHKKQPQSYHDADGLPGVQKIKSNLRQAKRLLAKDKLTADVRLETERKIKSLELELSKAEQARKERAVAMRYHKIKFFEKKKVSRKIKQLKSQLEETESKSEKKKLAAQLLQQRINLNYIVHYPKAEKYISLFPPEVRKGAPGGPTEIATPSTETDKTDSERQRIRNWVKEQMEEGGLPSEPENEAQMHKSMPSTVGTHGSTDSAPKSKPDDLEEDDFFGNDDDESS